MVDIFIKGKTNPIHLLTDNNALNTNLFSNTTLNGDNSKWSFPVGGGKLNDPNLRQNTGSDSPFNSMTIEFENDVNTGTVKLKNDIYLPEGTYTFSCYVWNARAPYLHNETYGYRLNATLNGQTKDLSILTIPTQKSWHKVSSTFHAGGKMSDFSLNVASDIPKNSSGIPNGFMYMADWKLERGNSATSWCPSIADYFPNLGG